ASNISNCNSSSNHKKYPRLYALKTVKGISVANKIGHQNISHSFSRLPTRGIAGNQCQVLASRLSDIVLPQIQDRWTWSLIGNGEFTVASVRKFLDDQKLPAVSEPTRWVKSISIKINVFTWKVSLDKLPTRFNLSIRGMDINCILCPICEVQAETTDHLFFSCSMASALFRESKVVPDEFLSAEAEYRGVANVVAETAWIRNLLCELHTPLSTATLVYCDNVSVVYMSANPIQHQRTKHIEIDIHFVRDFVASGQVRVLLVPSRFQYADIFTKGLPTALFIEVHSSLNVRRSPAHTEGE
nr:ribonuclease H-like domain-containing protein [Tanacetum cinerariifolium]